jgi:uncharacterized protein YjbI with pentapeptide repeats
MANQEHVALVRQVDDWNRWRERNPDLIPDLSRADLAGANFTRANLIKTDLMRADLSRVNLTGADLTNADLIRADLSGAKLIKADLSGARLATANLFRADLADAKLIKANLSGAELRAANLTKADLSGAELTAANLSAANLTAANLSGANLSVANLFIADFSAADLSGTSLHGTIFANTMLSGAKGLETCVFNGPCPLDHRTIQQSGRLPLSFLRGCGLPDSLIDYLPSLLNEALQFFSCFISYSHADKPFAKLLFDTLQGRGIRCWLDEKEMLPGDDIYDQVDRGIRIWDKVLLCCSKQSLSSWWIDNEIDTAFEKERRLMKERGHKVLALIPLDLDGHLFSGEWQSGKSRQVLSRIVANFRGWDSSHLQFETEVERIVLTLRADGGARPPAPKPKL